MTLTRKPLTSELFAALHDGLAIPAHPLALTKERKLDERRQRVLTRYYLASGAGGIAVAVHSTQFEIRNPEVGLLEPVLRLAAEEVELAQLDRSFMKVAGICGGTEQAVLEASLAASFGYEAGLLSMGGLQALSEEELLERTRRVADVIPVFGFYLQPSVGGRILSFDFWKAFAEIEGVIAIKMAPFNRYQTLDVVRAVLESSRSEEIALYTGNDDNIVSDLLTSFRFRVNGKLVEKKIVGGLLGHWAVWTSKAVQLLNEVKMIRNEPSLASNWLTLGAEVTDSNAAIFDPAHHFHGCIPGIHEVLRQQGLLEGLWCLNPDEQLSPGQVEEINRVRRDYPHLVDDEFVTAHLEEWLQ